MDKHLHSINLMSKFEKPNSKGRMYCAKEREYWQANLQEKLRHNVRNGASSSWYMTEIFQSPSGLTVLISLLRLVLPANLYLLYYCKHRHSEFSVLLFPKRCSQNLRRFDMRRITYFVPIDGDKQPRNRQGSRWLDTFVGLRESIKDITN